MVVVVVFAAVSMLLGVAGSKALATTLPEVELQTAGSVALGSTALLEEVKPDGSTAAYTVPGGQVLLIQTFIVVPVNPIANAKVQDTVELIQNGTITRESFVEHHDTTHQLGGLVGIPISAGSTLAIKNAKGGAGPIKVIVNGSTVAAP